MKIEISDNAKDLQACLERVETEGKDRHFSLETRVFKIENYKEQIEQVKKDIDTITRTQEASFKGLAEQLTNLEAKLNRETATFQSQFTRFKQSLQDMTDTVKSCEHMCEASETSCRDLMKRVELVVVDNISITAGKLDKDTHELFEKRVVSRMMEQENYLDKLSNKSENLQNWLDIYMPIRL